VALYVSQRTRTRRLVVIAAATAVAGLLVGVGVGRLSKPDLSARVREVHSAGADIATRVSALGIEYEKAASTGDSVQDSVLGPLQSIRADVAVLTRRAPWLREADRKRVTQALDSVRDSAGQNLPANAFEAIAVAAGQTIRDTLG
jgi:hypothetical protein